MVTTTLIAGIEFLFWAYRLFRYKLLDMKSNQMQFNIFDYLNILNESNRHESMNPSHETVNKYQTLTIDTDDKYE